MGYKIIPTAQFEKDIRKLDRGDARTVLAWIAENLENAKDPRTRGKRLRYRMKEYWRYRIGAFRLIVSIHDKQLVLELVTVGHRREIYR
jgi:mRNA interferase RelE/StbE